jgi:hypothetical protein
MLNRPMRLAPALSADNVAIDDFVIASTISETERDAAAKAARAFHEFWNTGDEAVLKRALAENFAGHNLLQGSEAANRSISAQPGPSARRIVAPHHS